MQNVELFSKMKDVFIKMDELASRSDIEEDLRTSLLLIFLSQLGRTGIFVPIFSIEEDGSKLWAGMLLLFFGISVCECNENQDYEFL